MTTYEIRQINAILKQLPDPSGEIHYYYDGDNIWYTTKHFGICPPIPVINLDCLPRLPEVNWTQVIAPTILTATPLYLTGRERRRQKGKHTATFSEFILDESKAHIWVDNKYLSLFPEKLYCYCTAGPDEPVLCYRNKYELAGFIMPLKASVTKNW